MLYRYIAKYFSPYLRTLNLTARMLFLFVQLYLRLKNLFQVCPYFEKSSCLS